MGSSQNSNECTIQEDHLRSCFHSYLPDTPQILLPPPTCSMTSSSSSDRLRTYTMAALSCGPSQCVRNRRCVASIRHPTQIRLQGERLLFDVVLKPFRSCVPNTCIVERHESGFKSDPPFLFDKTNLHIFPLLSSQDP
jgi:hypothetical protein